MDPIADPPSLRRRRRPRAPLLASTLAGLVGLCLLAPAGGRATPSQTTKDKYAAWLAYSRCMRSHGIRNFPDPKQVAGGGIQIPGAQSGLNPDSPLFMSARQSCGHLLPGGGLSTRAAQQQELGRMLRTSRCMRAHGVSGFPDPSFAPPSNRAGYSAIMSNDGVWLAIPDAIDVRSPSFEQAAAACNLG